ncbi:MAG: hypothetical protein IJO28_03330 [Oscillospiraceae bacterium]|nr:hypothetical protein [Oscillospiraceae bacterium]
MDHVAIRRLALSLAAVSFGLLSAVMLVYSACFSETGYLPQTVQTVAQDPAPQSLPLQVDGTALIVKNLAVYDGPFFEDGSGREVLGVVALVVQNSSAKMLRFSCIELEINREQYVFECMFLPPYSTVLIPEKTAKSYVNGSITACAGTAVEAGDAPSSYVQITASGMGSLCITNPQWQAVSGLSLYHKTYLADASMYIGGVAFRTVLPTMQPGEQVTVTPQNFAADYSQILAVEQGNE